MNFPGNHDLLRSQLLVGAETDFRILPRSEILTVAPYRPPLSGRRQKIRMDFNENTQGIPEFVPAGVAHEDVCVYPEYDALIAELAAHLGVSSSRVMLFNGSDEALSVIASTFADRCDKALVSRPTFPIIPHSLRLAGCKLLEVSVQEGSFTHDVLGIAEKLEQHRDSEMPIKLVMLASPDNPTGATTPSAVLEQWLRRFPDTLFVIDEAYQEYTGETCLPLADTYPNLIITRTFSKAWALAGLRLGYVVAHPQAIDYLTRVRSPYSVNAPTVSIARQALPKADQVQQQAQATMARKEGLLAAVQDLGYTVVPGRANFFLMRSGPITTRQLVEFLSNEEGVLVRDRSGDWMLNGYVRVTVGTDAENERFLNGLRRFRDRHALIFDLDETLVHTRDSFDRVVAELIEHFAPHAPLQPGELDRLRERGGFNDDWVATQYLLKQRNAAQPLAVISEEGTRRYLAIAKDAEYPLVDLAALARLQKRYRLMVFTGRRRNEYESVWGETLTPLFEEVLCVDDHAELRPKPSPDGLRYLMDRPKPSPDGLRYLMDRHKLAHAFYVGNSVDDVHAAIHAQSDDWYVTSVGVCHTMSTEVLLEAGVELVYDTTKDFLRQF